MLATYSFGTKAWSAPFVRENASFARLRRRNVQGASDRHKSLLVLCAPLRRVWVLAAPSANSWAHGWFWGYVVGMHALEWLFDKHERALHLVASRHADAMLSIRSIEADCNQRLDYVETQMLKALRGGGRWRRAMTITEDDLVAMGRVTGLFESARRVIWRRGRRRFVVLAIAAVVLVAALVAWVS